MIYVGAGRLTAGLFQGRHGLCQDRRGLCQDRRGLCQDRHGSVLLILMHMRRVWQAVDVCAVPVDGLRAFMSFLYG